MTGETAKISRLPVPEDELQWMPKWGRAFYVPEGCLSCGVLTTRACAQAVGLKVEMRLGMGGVETENYYPKERAMEAQREMERRVTAATDGSCLFVEEKQCWRLLT